MEQETKLGDFAQNQSEVKKPEFAVKSGKEYVGSAWLEDGKYGKYISVKLRTEMPTGARLFIAPTRDHPGLLG